MKKVLIIGFVLLIVLGISIWIFTKQDSSVSILRDDAINEKNEDIVDNMEKKINIIVNGITFEAILEDNKTVQEFLSLLPLEIDMADLNKNEKFAYFNGTFSTSSFSPSLINRGDIMLYGNDCLVIFYETFNTTYRYTKIGKITNVDQLKVALGEGNVKVRFEITDAN